MSFVWSWALLLAAATIAAPARASEGIGEALAAAERDVKESQQQLAALREAIAAEKLPMTRRLGSLEERLRELRQEYEGLTRNLDAGSLEVAGLQSETKLRQDEIAYLGNLLDEYVRGFESRLNPGETERYQGAIEVAKQAPGNSNLPLQEKLERQLAAAEASLDRAEEVVGGSRFEGSAVDPQGAVTEGRFALVGPVAVFASADGSVSGLAVAQSGSSRPAVRPLEGDLGASVASLVAEGSGFLPLDPTRGAALKQLVQRGSLVGLFRKGGPIMWPLLAVSVLALATVLERMTFIVVERRNRDERALQELLAAVEAGRVDDAVAVAGRTRFYVVRALAYGLTHREKSLPSALLYASAQEVKRFSRGLPILDTTITIAPLLGLLGTVTGMMNSFSLIGGELSAPAAITGGIAEALIATAFGLGIAILALIPFNYLNARIEEVRHELDAAATQLELLLQPHGRPLPAAAGADA